jgi:hypothetical protein
MPFRKKTEKKKNPFEASMPIDNPDVKVVTASFNERPFFIGIGTSTQREVKGSGQAGLTEGMKGEYKSQKYLEWELFYNPKVLPDFMPMEKVKNWMASTVAATSGSIDVFTPQTKFEETDSEILKQLDLEKITLHGHFKIGEGKLGEIWKVKKKKKP